MSKTYVIVDIETTGLKRDYHWITEIAAVRFDWEKIIDQWETLVNPWMNISPTITRLTWITNAMVADKPYVQEVLPWFLKFLWDDIFVAHNASFDKWFLDYNAWFHCWHEWTNQVLCTRKLANRMVPHLRSKSLASLCDYFSVTNVQAHRAMADVQATVKILGHMITLFEEHHTWWNAWDLFDVHDKSVWYWKSIFAKATAAFPNKITY